MNCVEWKEWSSKLSVFARADKREENKIRASTGLNMWPLRFCCYATLLSELWNNTLGCAFAVNVISISIPSDDVSSLLSNVVSVRRKLPIIGDSSIFHTRLFIDLFSGAQPLLIITKPPRAWVHHYGNSQVLVKFWNTWMPAKCISQRCHFHRAGFFRFVHSRLSRLRYIWAGCEWKSEWYEWTFKPGFHRRRKHNANISASKKIKSFPFSCVCAYACVRLRGVKTEHYACACAWAYAGVASENQALTATTCNSWSLKRFVSRKK